MSPSRTVPWFVIACLIPVLAGAQSLTPVQHPFRHNKPYPGEIFGNTNLIQSYRANASAQARAKKTYKVGNEVQVTTSWWGAEEEIAVDSANPHFLVAAISDFSSGTNQTKYAWSVDGGLTWSEHFIDYAGGDYAHPVTGDGLAWDEMSDPVVAIDSVHKIAYLSDLYFDDNDWGNGFYVSASPIQNGQVDFRGAATHAVALNKDPNAQTFEDKPWIVVDNTTKRATSGHVYVAWVHYLAQQYFPAGGEIHVARSTDYGTTFSTAVVVSPQLQVNNVHGPQIAVDPQGRVVVSWFYCLDFEPVPGQFNDQCMKSQIWGAVSTDGGSTFSTPIQVSPTITDLDGNGFPSQYRKWSAPAMAVDPRSGMIAVVYADQLGASSTIEFVRCQPGFAGHCSAPTAINDVNYGQRVFPAVAVDNLGFVHVSWYDSRNAPLDPYSSQLDIYATFARSLGQPFGANTRVTGSTINFSGFSFIGDYSGMAASGGRAHPVWTDGLLKTATLTASP